jgi:hypothetical protein
LPAPGPPTSPSGQEVTAAGDGDSEHSGEPPHPPLENRPSTVVGLISDMISHTDKLARTCVLVTVLIGAIVALVVAVAWACHGLSLPVPEAVKGYVRHYLGPAAIVTGGCTALIRATVRINRRRRLRKERGSASGE